MGLGCRQLERASRISGWGGVQLGKEGGKGHGHKTGWSRGEVTPEDELALENLLNGKGVKVWLVKAKQVSPD